MESLVPLKAADCVQALSQTLCLFWFFLKGGVVCGGFSLSQSDSRGRSRCNGVLDGVLLWLPISCVHRRWRPGERDRGTAHGERSPAGKKRWEISVNTHKCNFYQPLADSSAAGSEKPWINEHEETFIIQIISSLSFKRPVGGLFSIKYTCSSMWLAGKVLDKNYIFDSELDYTGCMNRKYYSCQNLDKKTLFHSLYRLPGNSTVMTRLQEVAWNLVIADSKWHMSHPITPSSHSPLGIWACLHLCFPAFSTSLYHTLYLTYNDKYDNRKLPGNKYYFNTYIF